jgi:hypothetical protein
MITRFTNEHKSLFPWTFTGSSCDIKVLDSSLIQTNEIATSTVVTK